ncbi:ABC transporter ATP-binding protein [Methylobacterium brachiatum]|uniref:ATP-binding component of ABC transporter-like putative high-affinity branched-chain amino acid transporter LivF-like n=1 Tax=Methylorubrum extorquens (strain DSM 6343 / CIP 106787 / DM4) TaxID=661410 RepID=A0A2P9HAZ1_METED|nr:ATP-binding cassette domain-containing protein [Methylorubrum extorquens]AYO84733.1 ATP-binding cassette domain-containing protein [Methylobacterium brachiatum]SPK02061.1 ATP-binding component of ABC transporter-like; putative high-affinity branched-chain amino acid transporter LivF-like [Methylorubrum extorquens DM4]
MLSVDGIDVSIGKVPVLRRVSIDVPKGAMVGVVGRNGAGKTTLMRAIMGLLPVSQGTIRFDARDLAAEPAYRRAGYEIGFAPEDRRLIPELTVEENLMIPAWTAGLKDAEARLADVYRLIPEAREFRTRRALQLSGGQQKLVAIGRARMIGTKLLILDEPFEGVAPALSKRIAEVVASLRPLGLSILLSGADLQHAGRGLDRVYRLDRGRNVAA